ncbi:MAG: ArsS family sensor histidine kinase [Campylobacter sp.]|nr:ArsS family sensor histidine kinase [Campylobacter sp.]
MLGMRIRAEGGEDTHESLEEIGLRYSRFSNDEIRSGGAVILQDSYCDMIRYQNRLFFVPREITTSQKSIFRLLFTAGVESGDYDETMSVKHIAALENTKELSMGHFWTLVSTINAATIAFFIVLIRKLLGLRKLKKQIRAVGAGNKRQVGIKSNDELGEIADEFNLTMQKINSIKEARELFLRNILHELRTPVMKGKIIAGIIKDDEFKEPLKQIFTRQEIILSEIVKLEKFGSNEWILNINEYRIIDIIDHALDLLFIKNTDRIKINSQKQTPVINADFELFSTAIKNLLDNALKYSKDAVIVSILADRLSIASTGEKIDDERLNFNRAFNRKTQLANSGLGLGLYISNQIFNKHGYTLKYEYKDGKNCFFVCF